MKLLLLFVLMALTSIVYGSGASSLDDAESLFKVFTTKYGKEYKMEKEKLRRFEIFKENLKRVSAMNEADPHAKFSPLTRWADMTEEEYTTMHGMHGPLGNQTPCQWPQGGTAPSLKPTAEPKESLDYVKLGGTVEVKNQGQCGSCWAHGTTAVVESRLFLDTGNITSLSEQFLLDCDQSRLCGGCCGGLPENSLQWLAGDSGAPGGGTGISSEADYPYDSASGTDPNPRCDESKPRVATLTGFGVLDNPDDASVMSSLNEFGVLAVALDSKVLQFYTGGIITDSSVCQNTNHVVAIVGYDSEDGVDYYKVRNSYGTEFGEDGYFRISRGAAAACGCYGCVIGGTSATYL
jgi:C1A family cysteine protease